MDRIIVHRFDFPEAPYWSSRFAGPEPVPHDPDSFIYGSRNAAWTLDEAGRVTEIRFFDAWDGIGDPSILDLAPDRVHRYAYDGDSTFWRTRSKNDNALTDDVFEHVTTVERDSNGEITNEKVTSGGRSAGDAYGGGEDDRLIIVGGTGDVDAYRAHFFGARGDIPDFDGG